MLRLDANLPVQPNLAFEDAAQMLGQAIRLSAQRPYRHEYIDKPQGMFFDQLRRFLIRKRLY